MADITIGYKGETIAEISASGTTTLGTSGKYCEDNITLQYVRPSAPTQNDDSIYLLRALPYTSYLKRLQKIIGGTVAWNQQYENSDPVNMSVPDSQRTKTVLFTSGAKVVSGHKYLYSAKFSNVRNVAKSIYVTLYTRVGGSNERIAYVTSNANGVVSTIFQSAYSGVSTGAANAEGGFWGYDSMNADDINGTCTISDCQLFDLTAMFGSTIADYIYTLEQGTAGAGVAFFKNLFPKDYYSYDAGSIVSVKTSASKAISPDGNSYAIYPFDSTIELRGIPKLDASNNLYYDGDEYTADGTVTRKYEYRAYQSGDESLENAITDGTHTVVKLSTPTTESATAYIEHQACFPNGTEQFVDGRTVEMPVEAVADYEVTS